MLGVMKAALLALAVIAGLPALVQVQTYPRLTRVAEGVFTYEQMDPTKRGVAVNNLIVVTSDGVLVADGQGTVENTKRLVEDIAALTSQPVRYVVIGSRGDHRGGDAAFPATVPWSVEDRPDARRTRNPRASSRARAPGPISRSTCPARGSYMSESFSNDIFPSMANGYPSDLIAALRRAEDMPVDIYVPAHSPQASARLQLTRDDVKRYRSALERVSAEGRRLHDAQVPADAAAPAADFGVFGAWIRRVENAPGALKRVYMELDGELKPEP
jgi:glyoxylase-like metal-dependent hydrolase (beta-lactamase superfamily II)